MRLVLVPATMQLLGERNWWLPRWLDRLLPSIDVEGHTAGVDPVDQSVDGSVHGSIDLTIDPDADRTEPALVRRPGSRPQPTDPNR